MSNYITFHNHDTKSLLDSCLKTEDLVNWAKANNMKAVGVSNHGEISSLLLLHKKCKEQGVKPLLCEEFYVTKNEVDEEGKRIRDNHHLIVIAKNREGWDNLIKLHNLSYTDERYYYDPRITIEDLIKNKEGLIITSACIGGILGRPWMNKNISEITNIVNVLQKEFGEDFYLELQNHNSEDLQEREKQHQYNKFLMDLSKDTGIECIVQNDSHYYLKEHWLAHQVLLCKNTGTKLSNPKFKFDSKEYWLKNEAEMLEMFNEYPLQFIERCFENTSKIADKVEEFEISYQEYNYPKFGEPEESFEKLETLTWIGFHNRFGEDFNDETYIERINYELETIKKIGFVDYFLILEDLYKFTQKENIYSGCGRGSAGGSLVLYCLNVTHVDPIKYNLLFERFINPDRISAPDVDLDFDDNDRHKVVQYLKNKYGLDHVCNIATYGELTAKSCFKAVASVLEVPFDKANTLSSVMNSNLSLKENYEQIDTFRGACQVDDNIKKAYEIALVLEGTYAQRGIHACGLVISNKPLDEICPCVTVKDTKSKDRITATTFEMKEIDGDLKMLKLDVLGLRNLGVIKEADKFIQKFKGSKPNFLNLDLHDSKTYKNLSDGHTLGVFQFESLLMQRIIKQIKPTSIEDLSCITALARPGCLESGLCDSFIRRRNGLEEITTLVEGTEELMKDTLQLPIYQENCMQLSRVMAGYTAGESDLLRKCIGKKDPKKLKQEREHFVKGAVNLGHNEDYANEIFDIIEKFGGYGFNKSHAVGYSLLSYITAYYKFNYPVEFMTALLNSVTDDIDKLNLYIGECFRLGISVLPPDVNESDKDFAINNKGNIRFGLNAIKGLGKTAVTQIINSRKNGGFKSVVDFIKRVTKVDKSALQALLKVGAFNTIDKAPKRWDELSEFINEAKNSCEFVTRNELENCIFKLIGSKEARKSPEYKRLADLKRELKTNKLDKLQKDKYTLQQEDIIRDYINKVADKYSVYQGYGTQEKIKNEQDLLGFNVSTNPCIRWEKFKPYFVSNTGGRNVPYIDLDTLLQNGDNYSNLSEFNTVGLLTDIKEIKTKKGDRMARLTVEHHGVKSIITVFSNQWEHNIELKIQKGNMVSIFGYLIEANKQYSTEDYEIRLEHIQQLNVLTKKSGENRCVIDVNKDNLNMIQSAVKTQALYDRKNNMPIENIVFYNIGNGKGQILNGLCWINNPNEVAKHINLY